MLAKRKKVYFHECSILKRVHLSIPSQDKLAAGTIIHIESVIAKAAFTELFKDISKQKDVTFQVHVTILTKILYIEIMP